MSCRVALHVAESDGALLHVGSSDAAALSVGGEVYGGNIQPYEDDYIVTPGSTSLGVKPPVFKSQHLHQPAV